MIYISWNDMNEFYLSDDQEFMIKITDLEDGSGRCMVWCNYSRNDYYMGNPVPQEFREFCDLLSSNKIKYIMPMDYYAVVDSDALHTLLKKLKILPIQ